jgi:O-antigen/teichoic acid export membrane protein
MSERVITSLRGHAASHAVPVLVVAIAMVVGSLAAFAFQVISARALGPSDFGQLAAFLALLNVAAIASSAMQNAVAVASAELGSDRVRPGGLSEATILGLGGAAVVAAFTPLLAHGLSTTPAVVLLAALAIPLTFWVAQELGVLQGAGRSATTVWWTTNALLIRVVLVWAALALGFGVGGVLAAVLVSMAATIVGAGLPARRLPRASRAVFSGTGVTVLALTLVSAWLVNSDVIIVRANADEVVAGTFASAAILVKAALTLPAALSVYLLPRFVRNRDNDRLLRVGTWATVAVTSSLGAVLAVVFWLAGDAIARLIFEEAYAGSGALLLPLALAYLPWVVAQGVLIRLTAHASRSAVVVLLIGAVVQLAGFIVAGSDITAIIRVQAAAGIGVLVALLVVVLRRDSVQAKRSSPA